MTGVDWWLGRPRPQLRMTRDQARELFLTGRCGPGPTEHCPICSAEVERWGTELIDRVARVEDSVTQECREVSTRFWPCRCEVREPAPVGGQR